MDELNATQKAYWNAFLASLPIEERPINPKVSASVAGNKEITDELLELYLSGRKTAGSSVVEDFDTAGDPLPQVGNYWIFLNSADLPSCILKTEKIVFHKFHEVPSEIAVAEGEGDLSLEYWRRVHAELYSPFLNSWGLKSIDDATIVTEFFRIVYR